MKEYKIKTLNEMGHNLPVDEIIAQLNLIDSQTNQAVYIRFDEVPYNFSPTDLEQIIRNLPKRCRGIDLGSLVRIDSSVTISDFEKICQFLPQDLIKLDAKRILGGIPTAALIERFLKALPAAREVNLKGNSLHLMNNKAFTLLKDGDILDLRANSWQLSWRESNFLFLKNIAKTYRALYVDLPTSLPEGDDYKLMCAAFFKKIPNYVHTLGLSIFGLDELSISELFNSFPATVHTIKWFNHDQLPFEKFFAATPKPVHTLDLSNWHLGRCQHYIVGKQFTYLPKHVHTLDLSNNELNHWSLGNLCDMLGNIPETVTQINLQANALFANKTALEVSTFLNNLPVERTVWLKDNFLFSKKNLSEREQLIEKIGSFLTKGHLVLDEDLVTPVIPLTQAMKQELITEDACNRIIFYLGAQTNTFFHNQGKKFTPLYQRPNEAVKPAT
ncbi:MAG: hypothetical protein J0I93_08720 [Legionella sp.]|nr:hypothetical protein [Legionella sp.]